MNKNIIILAGVGVIAYFLLRRKKPDYSGLVQVSDAEPISEDEYEQRRKEAGLTDIVSDVARTGGSIIKKIKDKRVQRNQPMFFPGSKIPSGMTHGQFQQFIKRKKREEARKKRQASQKIKRSSKPAKIKRSRRQRKMGEIGVFF